MHPKKIELFISNYLQDDHAHKLAHKSLIVGHMYIRVFKASFVIDDDPDFIEETKREK